MKIAQGQWTAGKGLDYFENDVNPNKAALVLYFWSAELKNVEPIYQELAEKYPNADIVGCSTGGEILGDTLYNDTAVFTVLEFDKSKVKVVSGEIDSAESLRGLGQNLCNQLDAPDLKGIFLVSEGLGLNGSELVRGFEGLTSRKISVTGGLAGDQDRFLETWVSCNGAPKRRFVAAVGFYGQDLEYQHGTYDGWESFGPLRTITKSKDNVLYELDGKPALDLYKKYLGDEVKNLPSSALLFPLSVWPAEHEESKLVRTILGIDEENKTMTFAGDVPEGSICQLMWGKTQSILEASARAAEKSKPIELPKNSLSIIVSCLGRKLLMGQRIVQELEIASKILGTENRQVGFYSYGEIAPHITTDRCELHNETMAITTLVER